MAPVIRISQRTYEKLQLLAKPFTDTPDSVISRLVDKAMSNGKPDPQHGVPDDNPERKPVVLEANDPGELKYTRVRSAKFGEIELHRPTWNGLLREAHKVALSELGSMAELIKATGANIRAGRYENEGFHYLQEADLSIQGQDSNHSWENSLRLAKRLSVPVAVRFEWHDKQGAAHPGQIGSISWAPDD